MATMLDLLREKGDGPVLSVAPTASVLEAAALMNERKVGALVVLDAERMTGIITERDVLQRVVAQRKDPQTTSVADVMTREMVVGRPDTTVDEARALMKHRRIRHMPILEGGQAVLGMISIGDLNAHLMNGQAKALNFLEDYIYSYH